MTDCVVVHHCCFASINPTVSFSDRIHCQVTGKRPVIYLTNTGHRDAVDESSQIQTTRGRGSNGYKSQRYSCLKRDCACCCVGTMADRRVFTGDCNSGWRNCMSCTVSEYKKFLNRSTSVLYTIPTSRRCLCVL